MPRSKRTNTKRLPPINLDMDNPQHRHLWEVYQTKTDLGVGATWIRDVLVSASSAYIASPPSASAYSSVSKTPTTTLPKSPSRVFGIAVRERNVEHEVEDDEPEELRYERIDE